MGIFVRNYMPGVPRGRKRPWHDTDTTGGWEIPCESCLIHRPSPLCPRRESARRDPSHVMTDIWTLSVAFDAFPCNLCELVSVTMAFSSFPPTSTRVDASPPFLATPQARPLACQYACNYAAPRNKIVPLDPAVVFVTSFGAFQACATFHSFICFAFWRRSSTMRQVGAEE